MSQSVLGFPGDTSYPTHTTTIESIGSCIPVRISKGQRQRLPAVLPSFCFAAAAAANAALDDGATFAVRHPAVVHTHQKTAAKESVGFRIPESQATQASTFSPSGVAYQSESPEISNSAYRLSSPPLCLLLLPTVADEVLVMLSGTPNSRRTLVKAALHSVVHLR